MSDDKAAPPCPDPKRYDRGDCCGGNCAAPPLRAGEYDGLIEQLRALSTLDYLPQDQAMKDAADALAAMQAERRMLRNVAVFLDEQLEAAQARIAALEEALKQAEEVGFANGEAEAERAAEARIAALEKQQRADIDRIAVLEEALVKIRDALNPGYQWWHIASAALKGGENEYRSQDHRRPL
jgi:hypothetical protein